MEIVTADEAITNFAKLLHTVEAGGEVLIERNHAAVARVVPATSPSSKRPKVGQMISPPFSVPDSAFSPLSEDELKSWGL